MGGWGKRVGKLLKIHENNHIKNHIKKGAALLLQLLFEAFSG